MLTISDSCKVIEGKRVMLIYNGVKERASLSQAIDLIVGLFTSDDIPKGLRKALSTLATKKKLYVDCYNTIYLV